MGQDSSGFHMIKPTRCTNFSNLFWKWNSKCFRQFVCPSSGVIHCTLNDGIYHTVLKIAFEQEQDGTAIPHRSCSKAKYKTVRHIPSLSVQWITPDDEQRNCLKHVQFHLQNKFEKLAHLVGFIIRQFIKTHRHMNVKKKTFRLYGVIKNDCRGFNNLSYTIHFRQQYMYFFI